MARLADDLIERIKHETPLLHLVESQGYQPKKQGKDYAICCPFHDDKTPSLIISPDTNLFNCFGCGEGGSVIDWVMKTQRLNFREAVVWLRNDFLPFETTDQLSTSQPVKSTQPSTSAIKPPSLAAIADDQALLRQVIDYYHQSLKQSPEALEYLTKRGLDDKALIDTFKLGYANRTLGRTLPEKQVKTGAEIRNQLQHIGLYRESGHEHFNGSLVIPVIDDKGLITEVYGRKLLNNLRKGTPKHLYLPGPHQGIFNPSSFSCPEIILCESLIDALTFWRWGFKNVTTSYGTGGFTDELFNRFKTSQTKRVLIAYDRDDAGNQAADKVATLLLVEGIDCYRIPFPLGVDANEYALTRSPARKPLEQLIRQADWMGQGKPPSLAAEAASEPSPVVALPASPQPDNSPLEVAVETTDNESILMFDNRRYRVRGLRKSMSYESLKINLCVSEGDYLHVDQLDLYNAKQRYSFIKQAAIELGVTDAVIKKDLAQVLLTLEQLQDEQIQQAVKPEKTAPELTNEDQQAALALLKDKHLLDRILVDFNRAGVVGEETNKLVGYLAAVSRKLDNPLAVIIQSTSAAGKSSLMNAVLAMMPEEERIQYSAMTGQSLFYMGETNLKHKILAIAEEEGAEQASYALKLLQSEGELTIASTGKDSDGNLCTQEYRVEGPVMLFSTTTAIDIDEELMNRCTVLTVNESRAQTELIHQMQRRKRTLVGLEDKAEKKRILAIHQNAQRLLKPLHIVNPYADQLTFLNDKTRTRRDHEKYLSLIDTLALLHQYQRPVKTVIHNGESLEYIEVALSDIDTANRLAHDVLGRTLSELPPQTRTLLSLITDWVNDQCQQQSMAQRDYRFSRRDIRESTGWSDNQLKVHCKRLEELEYLLIHRGSRGKSIDYELLFAGDAAQDQPQLMGLIDVEQLKKQQSLKKQSYDEQKLGQNTQRLDSSCPSVGVELGEGWGIKNDVSPLNTRPSNKADSLNGKTTVLAENLSASCRNPNPLPLVAETLSHPEV